MNVGGPKSRGRVATPAMPMALAMSYSGLSVVPKNSCSKKRCQPARSSFTIDGREDVRFGEAEILRAGRVAAGVEDEGGNGVVGLAVVDVAAVDAVLFGKHMVDAGDVLILGDGRGGARSAIVDAGVIGVWLRHVSVEELARVIGDAIGGNAIAGERLSA